jgi:hypothetical protein
LLVLCFVCYVINGNFSWIMQRSTPFYVYNIESV